MKTPTKNDRGFKVSPEKLTLLHSIVSTNSQNFLRAAGQTQHWKLLGDYGAKMPI
jgi:hypothetical protein